MAPTTSLGELVALASHYDVSLVQERTPEGEDPDLPPEEGDAGWDLSTAGVSGPFTCKVYGKVLNAMVAQQI